MKRALTILGLTAVLTVPTVVSNPEPAEAVSPCIGLPSVPKPVVGGKIGKAGMFCLPARGTTYETRVFLEQLYELDGTEAWIPAPYWMSEQGEKRGWYMTRTLYSQGKAISVRLRTCITGKIIKSTGIVVKAFGKTCSPAVSFN